jgi:hypothetical protein
MVGIALNHPFVNGNKRTGYIAGMTFLQFNGYIDIDVSLNDAQLGVWLEQVVAHKLTFEEFVKHLSEQLHGATHPVVSSVASTSSWISLSSSMPNSSSTCLPTSCYYMRSVIYSDLEADGDEERSQAYR